MTLLELVTHLRENILDDTGGTGVDWSAYDKSDYDSIQLRWTNEELTANINEAINQVYKRTHPIKDLITINATTTDTTYSLPSYVLKVLGVRRGDGKDLKIKELDDLWKFKDMNTRQGDIEFYILDDISNTLRISPIPLVNEDLQVLIYRSPLVKLDWATNTLSPELREEFHIPLLSYAASLCYLKDEANTLDPRRAETFSAMFDREFPFVSSYGTIRKRRTANSPVKYGGI